MHFRNPGEPVAPARLRHVPGLLITFVAISALVHGATLLLGPAAPTPPAPPPFGATVISTVLTPARQAPATPPASATPAAKPATSPVDEPGPATKPPQRTARAAADAPTPPRAVTAAVDEPATEPAAIAEPQARSTTPDTFPDTFPDTASRAEAQRNFVLGELQNQLSRHLSYPLRARKRGWQGVVLVAFNIDERGQLNDIQLAKSSGYALLDRSAIRAIGKVEQIMLPAALGRLQAMDLQLPVRYQLREG